MSLERSEDLLIAHRRSNGGEEGGCGTSGSDAVRHSNRSNVSRSSLKKLPDCPEDHTSN